ncbi:CHASE3 domain-containing protein [Paenibacillus agri]|uniref:Circadian input-output histidine kinase CikA n=1 Tax=Paenibacillus agri TaxID=2744309 RepID=A0A850EQT8_9BACL|nr:CHASE3 domain-containing protein [Paenibacillus agri]NUU62109.1 CHASE3 domain-containing protein [Paenibacillus agri]
MVDRRVWNLKIRGKIALGYFMILLMLGLFLLVVSARISKLEAETVFLSDHDMKVHELTYQIEKNVLDMETGQRGYALTGKMEYLPPYNNGLAEWRINYAKLNGLIADNPAQVKNLQTIMVNIEKWIEDAGQYVIDLKRNGQNEAVNRFFQDDTGKSIVDSIRSQSEYFLDNERTLTNARINTLKEGNHRLLLTMYILWGLVAVLAAVITVLIARSIVSPLSRVILAINNIASGGNLSERVRVRTHDELYDLGDATNRLLETVERDQWGSEQLSVMSILLQETTDLTVLCRTFLNKLASILELQYGAVYVLNAEDSFERIYSYAGSDESENSVGVNKIKPGEGLVGQCAQDMKLRVLEDLPVDYISINSGLGRTAPRYLTLAPVIFENKTLAVVEIASLTKWAPFHFELLSRLVNMLGVTLNSVTTRMEIQKLYGESQVMNEELQVQSEELQVQAEELQSYTKELLALNGELENQKLMAERSAVELEKYNEQLEQSSRYKSEFLANMSHELRTPLNSMLILSQLLSENRNESLNEEEQNYAAVIHSSGSELLSMINDILDLSKVEAGKMMVEVDAVNLTELPALLQSYFGKIAEQQNLDFIVALDESVPDLFYTDELRLHQILRNLLSNAFKFTEQGSVKVEVSRLEAFQSPGYASEEPVLAFAVTDSGIGISDKNSQLIFEAFRQADGSTARKFGGTGLGLSISLQLARLLGGHIALNSTPGEGSTFTLYLPCREEETGESYIPGAQWSETAASSADDRISAENPTYRQNSDQFGKQYEQLHDRTVLIVDDDVRNIFALEKGLEPYDMRILTAQTGFECLQMVREHNDIDIVLLDIMMPNLDGYDTLSIIREELLLTKLPILAISAKTMKEDREKCLAAGASGFMSKPVVLQEVVSQMCRLLEDRES